MSAALFSAAFWLPPLVRALTTALLVVSASVAAEAMGPFFGALIASLPVAAGPAYVFLAMQHGGAFVAVSALSGLVANAATGLLLIVCGMTAQRIPASRSLSLAILVWLAAILALRTIGWSLAAALLLNLAVYGGGLALPRPTPADKGLADEVPAASTWPRWFDLVVRAATVGGFVTLVVAASAALGPEATGTVAAFPISIVSLLVIVRLRLGSVIVSQFAFSALRPMLGFAAALLTLHVAVAPFGVAAALILALLVSIGWSLILLYKAGRHPATTGKATGGAGRR
jgi:hypothetical protein